MFTLMEKMGSPPTRAIPFAKTSQDFPPEVLFA